MQNQVKIQAFRRRLETQKQKAQAFFDKKWGFLKEYSDEEKRLFFVDNFELVEEYDADLNAIPNIDRSVEIFEHRLNELAKKKERAKKLKAMLEGGEHMYADKIEIFKAQIQELRARKEAEDDNEEENLNNGYDNNRNNRNINKRRSDL